MHYYRQGEIMVRPFDVSKFRKSITKSIGGISTGFDSDPVDWISTGNYCLNYLISGDFNKGVPLGRVTMLAGESGSGKSLIASGNIIKNAQDQGIFCIVFDSENALDEKWLQALNVDTSPEKLMRINVAMIDDVAKTISEFVASYRTDYGSLEQSERPKVMFVIDSLGMLLTPTDRDQFDKGDLKGDMGRKPKALTALIRNCVNMFAELNIGLVATNHTYTKICLILMIRLVADKDLYTQVAPVAMKKLNPEDENGNKISDVTGIRSSESNENKI